MVLAASFCAGCGREEIAVYRVPKTAAKVDDAPLTYTVPQGWQPQTPGGMDELARFSIADRKAELSVKFFPGEGASQLDLVNIVRQNLELPPLNDAELAKLVEPVEVGGEKGSLINLSRGTATNSDNSIMVAVVPHAGTTWFFKLAGISETVAAQKPALHEFLKSVVFTPDAAAPVSPHGETFVSANTGAVPSPAPSSITATAPETVSDKPAWQVPSGWTEVPPTAMLLSKFVISSNDGAADVTVSRLAGEGGGALPNINRWRGQLGLAQINQGELGSLVVSLDVPGGKAMLVDLNGKSPKTGKETRLIAVIWPREGQTWFYKLMGDVAVAGAQKDAFLKFIQSARYSNG